MNSKKEKDILIEVHLDVVKWVIRKNIHTNESIYGLGFEDLFQEGCILLCKAAETYDFQRAGFRTYAEKVVKNGLISYCRKLSEQRSKVAVLPLDAPANSDSEEQDGRQFADFLEAPNPFENTEILMYLSELKQEYTGTIRAGIEALEWLVRGYTITEIAKMQKIKPNLVGARISRAAQTLRQNPQFTDDFEKTVVEKHAA